MDLRKFFSLYFSRSLKTNPDNRSYTFAVIIALCLFFLEYINNIAYFIGLCMSGMADIAVQFLPFFSINFYLIFILISWFLYINRFDHLLPYSSVFKTSSADIRKIYAARTLAVILSPLSIIYLLFAVPFAVFILYLPNGILRLPSLFLTILIIDVLIKSLSSLIHRKRLLATVFSFIFYIIFIVIVNLNPQYNFISGHPEVTTLQGSLAIDSSGFFNPGILKNIFYILFNPLTTGSVPILLTDLAARILVFIICLLLDIRLFRNYIQNDLNKISSVSAKPKTFWYSSAVSVIYILLSLIYKDDSPFGRYIAVFIIFIISASGIFSIFRHEKTAVYRLLNSLTNFRNIIIYKHLRYLLFLTPVCIIFIFSVISSPGSALSFIHIFILPLSLCLPLSLTIMHVSPCSKNLNPVSLIPFIVPMLYTGTKFNNNYSVSIIISAASLLIYFRMMTLLETYSRQELLIRV